MSCTNVPPTSTNVESSQIYRWPEVLVLQCVYIYEEEWILKLVRFNSWPTSPQLTACVCLEIPVYLNGWWNWGLNEQTARFGNCLHNEWDYGTKISVLESKMSRCTNYCFLKYIHFLFSVANKVMRSISIELLMACSIQWLGSACHTSALRHRATSKCDT
jgi:hypothetical protein